MIASFLVATLILAAVAVTERTALAAVAGGVWPVDGVLVVAAIRMTAFSARAPALFVLAAALVAEIVSRAPFGAATAGVVLGLVSARLALFSVFSHRSLPARAACAAIGVVTGTLTVAILRILLGLVGGDVRNAGTVAGILGAAGEKSVWSAVGALLLTVLVVSLERRLGRGADAAALPAVGRR